MPHLNIILFKSPETPIKPRNPLNKKDETFRIHEKPNSTEATALTLESTLRGLETRFAVTTASNNFAVGNVL